MLSYLHSVADLPQVKPSLSQHQQEFSHSSMLSSCAQGSLIVSNDFGWSQSIPRLIVLDDFGWSLSIPH
jgi:hypothetical protein